MSDCGCGQKLADNLEKRSLGPLSRRKQATRPSCMECVSSAEAKAIEERLLYINNLSREELNKSYQQQLKQGTITADGSAGLGLYEVARQSGRPIEYSFSPLEDGNVFFELKIYVKVED